MPYDGQHALLLMEAQEVVHEGIDDAVGQRIFLVQQHSDEEGIHA